MHSNKYTVIFTAVLTIILGFFVSTADSSLKDMREKNIEADIRKKRQQLIYDQQERQKKFFEIIAIIFAGLLCVGVVGGIVWLIGLDRGLWG